MSDLNNLFQIFNSNITLTSSKKQNLKSGRNALRDKIRNDFKDKGRLVPKFCGQGSFMMKTTINPLSGDEYDIDDGVYLNGYSDKSMEEWPATSTAHTWIKNAVDGHTSTPPVDKNTCIRVIYAGDYHIDLPSYILKNDIPYLAHKKDGWIESDPKAFTDWFISKVTHKGEQLRSIVKYIKAWRDYKDIDLKSITITVLVANNYYSYNSRDDKALLGTITNVYNSLNINFSCHKPVNPYEELLSPADRDTILNALKDFKDTLSNAINEPDEAKAADLMRNLFGSRFPKGKLKDMEDSAEFNRTTGPAILHNNGRSA